MVVEFSVQAKSLFRTYIFYWLENKRCKNTGSIQTRVSNGTRQCNFLGQRDRIRVMPPEQRNLRSMWVLHTAGEICKIVSKVPRVLLSGTSARPLVEFTDRYFNFILIKIIWIDKLRNTWSNS